MIETAFGAVSLPLVAVGLLFFAFMILASHAYLKRYHISADEHKKNVVVIYGTQRGNGKKCAMQFREALTVRHDFEVSLQDMANVDPEKLGSLKPGTALIIFVSTYIDGRPPPGCEWFFDYIVDAVNDFRVGKNVLSNLSFAFLGFGDSAYPKNVYNVVAKKLDTSLAKLGAHRLLPLSLIDKSTETRTDNKIVVDLLTNFLHAVYLKPNHEKNELEPSAKTCCNGNMAMCDCAHNADVDHSSSNNSSLNYETDSGDDSFEHVEEGLVDVEDVVGPSVRNRKEKPVPKARRVKTKTTASSDELKEMVTPTIRNSLTKQGYKVVGSHSGVKLCRWTKSMLRGRGGCYKHTFYNIASHLCMEATPSLACANKCVYCWRHHTNPVGTEWKWKMDSAEDIIKGALEHHVQMIRIFRGVPGVRKERFEEALQPRHCALSLVGEPIMYPDINRLVALLHERHISTFLVTNAQMPDAIRSLLPVTQLYVSVDATDADSLKKIDRPLFRDFWERFIDSIEALAVKKQRTVFRLTLVKEWNMNEVTGYADLVKRGRPGFIEVKGVTYCGDTTIKGSGGKMTMKNVPWHEEVIGFSQKLTEMLDGEYELAAEHAHSTCVLIAHKRFKINGQWHTWIDYDKFHSLVESGKEFDALEYVAPTPSWAVYGSSEKGFDPADERFYRKPGSKPKDIGGC